MSIVVVFLVVAVLSHSYSIVRLRQRIDALETKVDDEEMAL